MKVLLIVDDEAYARQAVVNTIPWAEYGVEVYQASSGKEALEFMKKYTVDILMTDIRMPSMTGLELLEKVNQMGISPAVIMLSSYNEFELVRSAMQLGAEDYLFKPTMMPGDILESVQRVLEKKKEIKNNSVHTVSKKDILKCFLQGEKVSKSSSGMTAEQWKELENTEFAVVCIQLIKYQECLTRVFGDDLSLMQFSIGNVLEEVISEDGECFLYRINYKECAIICCKTKEIESRKLFIERIYNKLNSGFTFLKLYYQIEVAAGISDLTQGTEFLARNYAHATELCARADTEVNKIRISGVSDIAGSMKKEVIQALNYIGENIGNKELSLQMVADKIGVSKNYFSKIFKESMGVKFVDYITKLRMEQARNLYLNSDMKIYEIAELVGYSDWHYLYNLYKKMYGHSLSKEKEGKS